MADLLSLGCDASNGSHDGLFSVWNNFCCLAIGFALSWGFLICSRRTSYSSGLALASRSKSASGAFKSPERTRCRMPGHNSSARSTPAANSAARRTALALIWFSRAIRSQVFSAGFHEIQQIAFQRRTAYPSETFSVRASGSDGQVDVCKSRLRLHPVFPAPNSGRCTEFPDGFAGFHSGCARPQWDHAKTIHRGSTGSQPMVEEEKPLFG